MKTNLREKQFGSIGSNPSNIQRISYIYSTSRSKFRYSPVTQLRFHNYYSINNYYNLYFVISTL